MDSKNTMVVLASAASLALLSCEVRPYQTHVVTTTGAEIVAMEPTMVTTTVAGDAYEDTDPRALDDFRVELDPYGRWVDDAEWGTVWVPSIVGIVDFRPYVTAGHWAWDGDYVWVSDYPWGGIAFHYGRWVDITGVGWAWIPGRRYAGAWVDWSISTSGYLGWAPSPPTWRWHDRHAIGVMHAPAAPHVYVPRDEVFAPKLHDHVVYGSRAANLQRDAHTWTAPPPAQRYEQQRVGPPPQDLGVHRLPPPPQNQPLTHARELARPQAIAPQTHVTQAQPRVVHPQPNVQPRMQVQPQPRPSSTLNPRSRKK